MLIVIALGALLTVVLAVIGAGASGARIGQVTGDAF